MVPHFALLLALIGGPAAASDCPPLDRLDEGAKTGKLSEGAVSCLEAMATGAGPLADRLIASRLLIAQSFASGVRTEWARHVAHHLAELDPDNADLAVAYGAHLLAFGAPSEALAQAEHALDHAYVWADVDDRTKRAHEAYALRVRAARATLAGLPDNTPALERRALEGRIRLYAIEWLAHATASERDPLEALAACVDTGWEADRCRERAAGLTP